MESNPVFKALDALLEKAAAKSDRQGDVDRFNQLRVELKDLFSNEVPVPAEVAEVEDKQPNLFELTPPPAKLDGEAIVKADGE